MVDEEVEEGVQQQQQQQEEDDEGDKDEDEDEEEGCVVHTNRGLCVYTSGT